jgi:hypothetical protein
MYVRLKHTLSALTLEAISAPSEARFVPWLQGYAETARAGEAVPLSRAAARARALAAPFGWRVSMRDLAPLVGQRLLWRGSRRLALPRAYRPFWAYFRPQALRMYRAVLHLVHHPRHPTLPDEFYRGLVLFDCGLFFACHEYFEGLWRAAPEGERALYQGLVQVAAAFYHDEKGNRHGAVTLLRRARSRLEPYRPGVRGLDVDRILAALQSWEARFAQGEAGGPPQFVVQSERCRAILAGSQEGP